MSPALDSAAPTASERLDPRRWRILVFIAMAQLMVVLDSTIVNIALPSAQADLGIADGDREWVITAYALAFGGLLLLGGRIADLWGRKRAFVAGLTGFALASALGGAAVSAPMMFGARALQGVFAALLAPAALSLLSLLFSDVRERARAFGVYGAIAGAGSVLGLVLGGALTQYLDWRWTFYVNVPIAVVAAVGALVLIREPAGARNRATLDLPGVLLSSLGLFALVYGFARAESHGWGEGLTLATFAAAVLLLVSFVLLQARVPNPMLPLRVVLDRNRGGAYLVVGLAVISLFGLFLFLTFYLQSVKGYEPVVAGAAFLPMSVGMIIGSTQVATWMLARVSPRMVMVPGLLTASLGMLMLTQLEVDSSYMGLLLPAQLALGLGMGTTFMVAMNMATARVPRTDVGVASAMVNTSQQVGGAIGVALLNTIAAGATTRHLLTEEAAGTSAADELLHRQQAMVHGFTSAIWWGFGALLLAAVIAFLLISSKTPRHPHIIALGGGVTGGGVTGHDPVAGGWAGSDGAAGEEDGASAPVLAR
ncbi:MULTISPECIES: MFS transporter [unclassified Streptomyces]|uniref:MFS transporter n=1 Tax=unclassified Streptomyces TaxID=2593676 RepID=UPI000CD4B842|nr:MULTISPECIES: MFS transporter [unclassified Streptomyces]